MARPIAMAVRQSIIQGFEQGISISQLSRNYKIGRTTIHQIIKRYKENGEEGLKPHYKNCGKPRLTSTDLVYRAVRCLKTWHPNWGAEKIKAEILLARPNLALPTVRTLNRWFQWNQQNKSTTRLPKTPRKWAKFLHEGWQIDAKEEMLTMDGNKQCWLNIVDEKSGTVIDPPVFSL